MTVDFLDQRPAQSKLPLHGSKRLLSISIRRMIMALQVGRRAKERVSVPTHLTLDSSKMLPASSNDKICSPRLPLNIWLCEWRKWGFFCSASWANCQLSYRIMIANKTEGSTLSSFNNECAVSSATKLANLICEA